MRRALATVLLMIACVPAASEAKVRLDHSFAGGHGWKPFLVGGRDSSAYEVLRMASGKLLVGGYSGNRLGFARLHPSGRFDRRFSRDGRMTLRGPLPGASVSALAEVAGGRVLVAVHMTNFFDSPGEIAILRLRANGALDTGYGTNGVTRIAIPGDPESVAAVGMAKLPRGGAMLVGRTRLGADERAATVTVDANGVAGEPALHDLDGHHVIGIVRVPSGRFLLAANRYPRASEPARALLQALTPEGRLLGDARLEVAGATIDDLARDGQGVAALFTTADRRWGVRRYTDTLVARAAPARLPSSGAPHALAMDRRHRAWVAFDGGRIARVLPDGRPDRRFAPPGGKTTPFTRDYILDANDVIVHPRGGALAVGRAHQDFDIREDYGPSRMWIARFF